MKIKNEKIETKSQNPIPENKLFKFIRQMNNPG